MENVGTHSPRPLGELPRELSSVIGREHEISEVKQLLGDTLLLTLTGPGPLGQKVGQIVGRVGSQLRFGGLVRQHGAEA